MSKKSILIGRIKTDEEFAITNCTICQRQIEVLKKVKDKVPENQEQIGLCFHCFLDIRGIKIRDPFNDSIDPFIRSISEQP